MRFAAEDFPGQVAFGNAGPGIRAHIRAVIAVHRIRIAAEQPVRVAGNLLGNDAHGSAFQRKNPSSLIRSGNG